MKINPQIFASVAALVFGFIISASDSLMTRPIQAQTDQRGLQVTPGQPLDKWPGREKRFALIIGVDQYQDGQISRLEGASNDTKRLVEALVQYAGFPRDQITLLSSDQPLEKWPTRAKILFRLSTLRNLVPKDGLLLVAFSGHGIERARQAYLLPMDAQVNADTALLEDTAISVERMRNLIADTGVGQVILIIDACRNDPTAGRGDSDNKMTESYVSGFDFSKHNREITAFATLYATRVGDRAYEYKEKKQGYFTWALIEGLKGGAANEKGEVTLGRLVAFLQNEVPKRTRDSLGEGKRQQPFAVIEGYKADELVIAVAPIPSQADGVTSVRVKGQPLPEPVEILRTAQTVFITSKSKWFKAAMVESELRKRPEFDNYGLKLVKDKQKADIHIELDRPWLTYTYIYRMSHPETGLILASGKIVEKPGEKSMTGSNAAVEVVNEVIKYIHNARTPPAPPVDRKIY